MRYEDFFKGIEVDHYEPIPAGRYTVGIESVEQRDAKTPGAKYETVKMRVSAPHHVGAVVFSNITLKNPSAAAVYWGAKMSTQLFNAAGLDTRTNPDFESLVGRTVDVIVTQKDAGDRGIQNEVKAFLKTVPSVDQHVETKTEESRLDEPPF